MMHKDEIETLISSIDLLIQKNQIVTWVPQPGWKEKLRTYGDLVGLLHSCPRDDRSGIADLISRIGAIDLHHLDEIRYSNADMLSLPDWEQQCLRYTGGMLSAEILQALAFNTYYDEYGRGPEPIVRRAADIIVQALRNNHE